MKIFVFIFSALFCALTLSAATSVEKSRLTSRTPGIFQISPEAALNTQTGQTLVVWEQHQGLPTGHSIWGRRLNIDGSPLGPASVLVNGPNARQPEITYHPGLNQFLLIYENDLKRNNRFAVFAVRLTAAGRRAGRPVTVSETADSALPIANITASLIFDTRANSYIVLWMRTALNPSAVSKEGLYAAVLNPNLSFNKSSTRIHPLLRSGDNIRGPFVTDLRFHPLNGKLLVAGYVLEFIPVFSWRYFVSSVNLSLQNPAIRLLNVKAGTSGGAAPDVKLALLARGQSFAVFVEGTGLMKRKLNPLGRPIAVVTSFFNSPLQGTKVEFPEVISGNTPMFAVAVEVNISPEKIWLQTYNAASAATGAPVELDSNTERVSNPIVTQLRTPIGAAKRYALIYVDGRQQFPPMPGDSSGLTLLRLTFTP